MRLQSRCAADAAPATPHAVVLRAARMFDGASGKLVEHPQLTIVGNTIVRIAQGDKLEAPVGADVIDLGDAARLLGTIARVGTLEAGKLADVVAVPGNPIADITVTERPVFVMKDGVVVRRNAVR